MKAFKSPKISVKEYISQEIANGIKYEYHNGEIYALAGGTINHGLLCGNIYAELRTNLKNKQSDCKPVTSELKLYIEATNSYVYPDTMVVCGEIETSEQSKEAITNPTLVVEVLSKSTSDYDRGDKFYMYRQIPTLQEYILIEQDKAVVEIYYKKLNTDLWSISRFAGLENIIEIKSLGVKIKMADLYFDIDGLLE